jgi:hypothetical protein
MSVAVLDRPQLSHRPSTSRFQSGNDCESLAEIIERCGPMPRDVALECLYKIDRAIRIAHEQGVSCRPDPSMILVNSAGVITLANEYPPRNELSSRPRTASDLRSILDYLLTGSEESF